MFRCFCSRGSGDRRRSCCAFLIRMCGKGMLRPEGFGSWRKGNQAKSRACRGEKGFVYGKKTIRNIADTAGAAAAGSAAIFEPVQTRDGIAGTRRSAGQRGPERDPSVAGVAVRAGEPAAADITAR